MIRYPSDDDLRAAHDATGLPLPVLVRDVVRLVEVLNLNSQGFFGRQSVLSGSMGLRCFGSPRFTVLDADFSTTTDAVANDETLARRFEYRDDDLEILPEAATPNDAGRTLVKVQPITFDPVFTNIGLADRDKTFHADVSFRGMLLDGQQIELKARYLDNLWPDREPPVVWVMAPVETLAEKILGWCAHRIVKHYADAAWIADNATRPGSLLTFNYADLREVLDAKREKMSALQPHLYAELPTLDAVIGQLARPPGISDTAWRSLTYMKGEAPDQAAVIRIVQNTLAQGLRRSAPR